MEENFQNDGGQIDTQDTNNLEAGSTDNLDNSASDNVDSNIADSDNIDSGNGNNGFDIPQEYKNEIIGLVTNLSEDIDKIQESMTDEDILVITADHGCDPTVPGTDHTREQIPVLIWGKKLTPANLGIRTGFNYIADVIREWLF